MLTFGQIKEIEMVAGGSPFYIVDSDRFEANFDEVTAAFKSRYQPFALAYSYKTNYIPYLCGIIRQKGGWAEVVSRMEYDLALKIRQDPRMIVFNGPVKTADDINLALDNGSLVNVDSLPEFELVMDYAQKHAGRPVRLGLRINIGLFDEAGKSSIQDSLPAGRFGFDPEKIQPDIVPAMTRIKNVSIVSLHGHTSTTDRSRRNYEKITETLCQIAGKYFPDTVEYINVGGGFFGRMHPQMPFKDTPTFDDYAQTICEVMKRSAWAVRKKPALMIEPGVAMVADCVSLVTRVVSVKRIRGRLFVTTDGSAFHCKPTFHSLRMPHRIITAKAGPVETYDVVGATCMEKDVLLKDLCAPMPAPGDYIKIDNIGAYTIVLTPPFIHPAPAIVADEGNGSYKRIRSRQTLDEIFSNYVFE